MAHSELNEVKSKKTSYLRHDLGALRMLILKSTSQPGVLFEIQNEKESGVWQVFISEKDLEYIGSQLVEFANAEI